MTKRAHLVVGDPIFLDNKGLLMTVTGVAIGEIRVAYFDTEGKAHSGKYPPDRLAKAPIFVETALAILGPRYMVSKIPESALP